MTETTSEIFPKIEKLFLEHFAIPEKDIDLIDQLSSLELVHLVTVLEKNFGISISALEINTQSFRSLDALANMVQRKVIAKTAR